MRISELVKTYKWINDPNAPGWNIKFVGGVAIVALFVAGVGALAWTSQREGVATPNQFTLATSENADGTRTDYVGYIPSTFNAALGFDPDRVEQAFRDWERMHPGATVLAKKPVWSAHHVIGYEITYRP